MNHAKADACAYILTVLLQRLEAKEPDFIAEMISGVKADQNSISDGFENFDYFQDVLKKASRFLKGQPYLTLPHRGDINL